MKIHLIRHARSEKRVGWDGPGPLRPLSPLGLRQAGALAEQLAGEPVARILSSPHLRCRQTVAPLAQRTGLAVELDERLAEGERPAKVLELLRELGDSPALVCSHGDILSPLLSELEEQGAELRFEGPFRCEKGSIWTLEGSDGVIREGFHRPPSPQGAEPAGPDSTRFGVLDLGSTSFRLLVADSTRAGRITPVSSQRIMLRLGAAIALGPRIPDGVFDEAVEVVRTLGRAARKAKVERLLPVATAAFRDAENGPELAEAIAAAVGAPVRIVGGEEEARLVFGAFRRRVPLGPGHHLGVDLGGGSLELVVGDHRSVHWEATTHIGVTRLKRELIRRDPMRKREVRRVRERVQELLAPHRDRVRDHVPETCVVVGGTARALARLVVARRGLRPSGSVNQLVIPAAELRETTRDLVRSSHDERLRMAGMRKHRADLLPVGGIILTTLAEELGIEAYTVSDWGLREGVIIEALGATD